MPTTSGVPQLSDREIIALCETHYGLDVRVQPLPSERDQTVRVHATMGDTFVLKVAHADATRAQLDAEHAALDWVREGAAVPRVVHAENGDTVVCVQVKDQEHFAWLITAVDGVPLATVAFHSDALRRHVGRTVGALSAALEAFDHPAAHRISDWDLAQAARVVEAHRHRVAGPLRDAIDIVAERYAREVAPHLAQLRRSVVHGDANDYNVLVHAATQRVAGIVDFGDMVYSHTVNDAAIAMAYVALSADAPLAAVAQVAAGFHEKQPFTEAELSVLFGLMCMRLAVSACMAARQLAERPDHDYLDVSQEPIRRVLPLLADVHPRFAHYTLREACGLPAAPSGERVRRWIAAHSAQFAPLMGEPLTSPVATTLDMSVGSSLLSSDPDQNAAAPLDSRIEALFMERGARFGVGGYNEARLIYRWPTRSPGEEPRTIHLGVDVTAPVGTPLYAPLDGVVHGFENADGYQDYGPVIVFRHMTTGDQPTEFYTLYGHLSLDSLDGLELGQFVARGEEFARIGPAPVNGNWWAHVHAQLMVDMLDVPCNVHGAARASERGVWLGICPDPNTLFGIAPELRIEPHRTDALVAERQATVAPSVRLSQREQPLAIARGYMQYLYDSNGRRYIDAYNNVPHVGHSHPRVVRAVSEQLAVLNTNTRYLQHQLTDYATELLATLPSPLAVCYFTASGSEANELALRLARSATGARDLIVMDGAYHGHTTTLIDASPYKHNGPGGEGAPEWVHTSPLPDVYRTPELSGDPGVWFAAQVGEVIARLQSEGRALGGYLAETCPSVGGQIMLPDGFLADVYTRVRVAGGVCIADEVQTGFGRLGSHFWAFEPHGVLPDIVVLGKPMANGYPMGAVVTTRAIAERFDNGMEYFSTFGGSTAACVAALTTLRVTQEEELPANAARVGQRLLKGFRELQARHDLIGDVRGAGLFLGVELVRDLETRAPAAAEASLVVQRLRNRHILAGTDGPLHNVLKFRGPMCLTLDNADQIVDALDKALAEVP